MRYTLSVLTAAGLLALGQPAWSEPLDRELLQRVRLATLAWPGTEALHAQALQASAPAAPLSAPMAAANSAAATPATGRALSLNRMQAATQQLLQQHYASSLQALALPPTRVARHWLQPDTLAYAHPVSLALDAAMVARWADARLAAAQQILNPTT